MVTLNKQFSGNGEILARVENEIDFWLHEDYFRIAGYNTYYAWDAENVLYIQAIFAAKFPDNVDKWNFLANVIPYGQLVDILRKIFP